MVSGRLSTRKSKQADQNEQSCTMTVSGKWPLKIQRQTPKAGKLDPEPALEWPANLNTNDTRMASELCEISG